MKKVLLVLAMAGIFVACGDKKKSDTPTTGDDTASKTTTTPPANNDATPPSSSGGVPTFSDPEVQKFANDVTEMVNGYMEAAKTKDFGKMTELSTKWAEWGPKAAEIPAKMAAKPEEAKAWAEYWSVLSAKWTEAAKAMIPTGK